MITMKPEWIPKNELSGNYPRQQGAIGMVYYGSPNGRLFCDWLIFPLDFHGETVPEQKTFNF